MYVIYEHILIFKIVGCKSIHTFSLLTPAWTCGVWTLPMVGLNGLNNLWLPICFQKRVMDNFKGATLSIVHLEKVIFIGSIENVPTLLDKTCRHGINITENGGGPPQQLSTFTFRESITRYLPNNGNARFLDS